MGVELSEAEKKALDQLKKACDKRGPKSTHTLQNCALLKQQLIVIEKEKAKEIELALLANKLQQVGNRLEAIALVTASMNAIQNEGILLVTAMQKASGEYDQILAARAKQPLSTDIILG